MNEKFIYVEEGNQNYVLDTLKVTRYLAANNWRLDFSIAENEDKDLVSVSAINEDGDVVFTETAPWNLATVLYHHIAKTLRL